MYIIKAVTHDGKTLAFKTYDGWDIFRDKPLELGNVMRFTEGEAKANPLPDGQEYLYFGCYKPLDKGLK